MQHKTLKLTGLSIALASLLTACGGGGSSGSSVSPVQLQGRAIDGPLAGATVKFIDCGNATTETDATGNFNFPEGCSSSQVHITGGIDTTTDLPFSGELKAPRTNGTGNNQIIVSPITTLIQASVAAGATPEAAAQQVAAALNLGSIDLLSADPMQNKELYAKTVAVQQMIEQIQEVISSVGATTSQADLSAQAFTALQSALRSSSTTPSTDILSNTNVISSAISATLEAVKADLPTEIANNLENVKTNLAAASADVIAANVKSVETAIQNIPASAFTNTGSTAIESIKTASQEAVVAAKETVAAERLIETLAPALTQPPAQVQAALQQVAQAVANNEAPSTVSDSLNTLATAANISTDNLTNVVANPNAFYSDYLQLDGFAVQGTNYSPAQLTASLATPVAVPSVKDLLIGVKAVGTYTTTANPILTSPAILLSTGAKTLSITADKLYLTYTAGTLTAAVLPAGAEIRITSDLNTVASTSFTLNSDKSVLSNGKIALNSTTLASLSSSLATQLASFNLANQTVTVTTVMKAEPRFAILKADNTPVLASKYTVGNTNGAGISAKFKPAQ